MMEQIIPITYPWQKKQDQNKTWKNLNNRGYPSYLNEEVKIMSSEESASHIARILSGAMNG